MSLSLRMGAFQGCPRAGGRERNLWVLWDGFGSVGIRELLGRGCFRGRLQGMCSF